MDNDKINLLRELLSDDDVRETLKKILLEDRPKKAVKKKTVTSPKTKVKAVVKKTTTRKPRVKKQEEQENFKTNKVDKYSKDYGRSHFVDNLTEALEEEVEGKKINLIAESKKLSKIAKKKPKQIRPKKTLSKLKCTQCNKHFFGVGGYLCDNCLKGKNPEDKFNAE